MFKHHVSSGRSSAICSGLVHLAVVEVIGYVVEVLPDRYRQLSSSLATYQLDFRVCSDDVMEISAGGALITYIGLYIDDVPGGYRDEFCISNST